MPAEDRESSPYTGWTLGHWKALADGLLGAAWRYASPGCALLDLPGRPSRSGPRSDGLEGYARTFLMAAFRAAGDPAYAAADPDRLLERYTAGVVAGTRAPGRDDAESWPLIRDHMVFGQPMVESASVALGLRLTAPWTWERMSGDEQDRAEAWLRDALRHQPPPNNWYLFPYTVAGFLESVGRGDARTAHAIERGHGLLDDWYRGGGWYTDGDGAAFDHYNGWALHLYPLLHAHLSKDQELLERYGSRLAEFLEGFGLLFDADGAPVHQGRSLTYRFAAGAAIAVGALVGHTPLAPGASRRILSAAARYFLDRGALSPHGLLTLGWHGPHESTLQPYSGPASPYWASKAFAALLVPADDPLWTAVEEPPEEGDRTAVLAAPNWLVQRTGSDGLVRLHNHGAHKYRPGDGERHPGDPLYARLAYSTRSGPTSAANVPDNHIGVEWRGRMLSARPRVHPLGNGPHWAASWHRPRFPEGGPVLPSARIESLVLVRGAVELRVHRLLGFEPETVVRATGWAVDCVPERQAGPSEAGELTVRGAEVTGRLLGLLGWSGADLVRAPQGTAYGDWALVPRLTGSTAAEPAGEGGTVLAELACLSSDPAQPPLAGSASAEAIPGGLRVRWAEDGSATEIRFSAEGPSVTAIH
ncbi:DUF2264 domain-containing protein [Phaeacidiphilus oryzae]|uniref:DUF2264 domain-containing protein n=1 Tax=Phaeacidiphilus oryzae TaxID=348818 RepID=UPI00056A4CF4|nr:DUF2264 domain-containing protein [Phaeacidiphilus oryzae]